MAKVHDSLNDVAILHACIPGCEQLVKHSDTELEAVIVPKIAPVKAKFSGQVTLDTPNAPDKFSLAGVGDGGGAGFAKGGADVELIADGDFTLLRDTAKAETSGINAQLGSRLIASTASKLSMAFFENFEKIMRGEMSPDRDPPPPTK